MLLSSTVMIQRALDKKDDDEAYCHERLLTRRPHRHRQRRAQISAQ